MLCNRLQSPKATAVGESYRQHSRSSVARQDRSAATWVTSTAFFDLQLTAIGYVNPAAKKVPTCSSRTTRSVVLIEGAEVRCDIAATGLDSTRSRENLENRQGPHRRS
jgi:hypothetical protein